MAISGTLLQDHNYHGPVFVFDLDDTLIRERDFCRTGFEAIRRELTGRFPDRDLSDLTTALDRCLTERRSFIPVLKDYIISLIARTRNASSHGDAETILNELLDLYGSHTQPVISPLPKRVEVLEELARRGYRMALITDGRSNSQRAKLSSAGLLRFFHPDLIFISSERGVDKSSPELFSLVVRQFPEANKFIYVGDNPEKDLEWPTLLGWETFLVEYSPDNVHPRVSKESMEFTPTYSQLDFPELLNI